MQEGGISRCLGTRVVRCKSESRNAVSDNATLSLSIVRLNVNKSFIKKIMFVLSVCLIIVYFMCWKNINPSKPYAGDKWQDNNIPQRYHSYWQCFILRRAHERDTNTQCIQADRHVYKQWTMTYTYVLFLCIVQLCRYSHFIYMYIFPIKIIFNGFVLDNTEWQNININGLALFRVY